MTETPAGQTPNQTIGPYFAIMMPLGSAEMAAADDPEAITIRGRVFDGAGAPVTDAVLELWQANRHGRYAHPADTRELLLEAGFTGFGRTSTDADGAFRFLTVKPGSVPGEGDDWQAPHITVSIFARGLLNHLVTRIYFPDAAAANAADPLLRSIADPAVRATLVASQEGPRAFRFDIRLRGEGETAFLAR